VHVGLSCGLLDGDVDGIHWIYLPFPSFVCFSFSGFYIWGQGTVGAWMPNDTHVFNDE
jgi:hypothetical protein